MTLEEMNEKTADIMGWVIQSIKINALCNSTFKWYEKNGMNQYSVTDWQPTKNIEQFFMILEVWCKKNSKNYILEHLLGKYEFSVGHYEIMEDEGEYAVDDFKIFSVTRKELMPKVIEAICEGFYEEVIDMPKGGEKFFFVDIDDGVICRKYFYSDSPRYESSHAQIIRFQGWHKTEASAEAWRDKAERIKDE